MSNSLLSAADLLKLQRARDEYSTPVSPAQSFAGLLSRAVNHLDFGREADARELLNQADALLIELEAEDDGLQEDRAVFLERVWQRLNGDQSELED